MNSLCGEAQAHVWRRGPTPEIQILYLQLEFEYFTFLECNFLSGQCIINMFSFHEKTGNYSM